jgi:ArsR family transcriptional regulator, lead/cadmium/zinc/bismuth-responsive transcriptional repressor
LIWVFYMIDNDAICQTTLVNKGKVVTVKEAMLDEELFSSLSKTFRAFGDRTRMKILYALSREELCVCDLSCVLDMTVSAISHQLRVLRNMNLVNYRKEGKMAYYSLCDDHVEELIEIALTHVRE